MTDLRELYQQLIIDHGRKPRNFGELPQADCQQIGYNPLCGDRLTIYIVTKNNMVERVKFSGEGCAISMASASLMTEALKGKTLPEVKKLFTDFHAVVTGKEKDPDKAEHLGKLAVLSGVSDFPVRVKCATLCWHTALAALTHGEAIVSTE